MSVRHSTLQASTATQLPAGTLLQRKCACGSHTSGEEECEQCKRMQRRAATADDDEFEIPPIVGTVLSSPGRPLDAQVREQMEAGFGHDFHDVRVHTDATAQRSARSVNALAYTVGRNVVFDGGQYAPGSQHGMHLLAHELAHVVQQRGHLGGAGGVGRGNTFLEHAADSAADRVVRGQPAPAAAAAPHAMLARKVKPAESTSIPTPGPCIPRELDLQPKKQPELGERKPVSKDGQNYLVERIPWTKSGTGPITRLEAKPGIDAEQVWLQFEWCRGNKEGTVRAAANVPEAALKLVRDAIAKGGDIDAAWKAANFKPSLTVTARSGTVDLSISGNVTVGTDGKVKGGGGALDFSTNTGTGSIGVNANVNQDESSGLTVTGGFKVTWGGERKIPPRCEAQWVRSGYNYLCYLVEDVPARSRVGDQRVDLRDEQVYHMFFEHAQAEVLDALNPGLSEGLREALNGNFQITSVEGWASPEGPMGTPADPEAAKAPEGNKDAKYKDNLELSQRRADAAHTWLDKQFSLSNPSYVAAGATFEGKGERMDPLDPISGQPQDIAGAALEEHVDTHFADDPSEASVRTPEMLKELRRTPTRKQRVEKIYRKLRRAELHLRRNRSTSQVCKHELPATTKEVAVSCSDEIRRLAYPDKPGGL